MDNSNQINQAIEQAVQDAGLSSADLIFGSAILTSVVLFILSLAGIFWILTVICRWRVFTKAGEKGWKTLIPIYSDYIRFGLFWGKKPFFIYLAANIITTLFVDSSSTILVLLALASSIVTLVIVIRLIHRTSLAFGHGVGFTLGLIFLSPVFTLILGFGKSQYLGVPGAKAEPAAEETPSTQA